MEVAFSKIHSVVTEALKIEKERSALLWVIGEGYFNFLESSEKRMSLHLPFCSSEYLSLSYDYLRAFSLTYRLTKKTPDFDYAETCLFDIFNYNKRRTNSDNAKYTLDFLKSHNDLLFWENDTVTAKNRFLPVFKKDQVQNVTWDKIYKTFKLFQVISTHGLVSHPVLLDFEKDLCLSLTTGDNIDCDDLILFKTLKFDPTFSEEEIIELESDLQKKDFAHLISVRYPYHKNIHNYLLEIGERKFDLVFNSRFCYYDLEGKDLVLLPTELTDAHASGLTLLPKVEILDTNHNIDVFKLLSELRTTWGDYGFNKFTIPFPKYWMLFINPTLSKEEWVSMFIEDYPTVAEKPIINEIKKVISEIHQLNWGRQFIQQVNPNTVLLPSVKSNGKKKLEKALSSFKHYLLSLNSNLTIIDNDDNYDLSAHDDVAVLDAFNIITLVNLVQNNPSVKILLPDFLYFNYQPWIKYQVFEYQNQVLFTDIRKIIDKNFSENKVLYDRQRTELIQEIRLEIREYTKKYKEDLTELVTEDTIASEDMIFKNDEEVQVFAKSDSTTDNKIYEVKTESDEELSLKGHDKVLVMKNSLVLLNASQLELGDRFILQREISSSINKDLLVNKLSRVPDSAIHFQIQLSKFPDVYESLESQGLEYRHKKYFNDTYVIEADDYEKADFILPKKKDHWKIICEFLGISSNDMLQTWIAHYGRAHLNDIKRIYQHIYELCIENNYLGEIENPALLKTVSDYLSSNSSAFESEEQLDPTETAKSILSSISNEIDFHEVKEIKNIGDE
jgi:hypothetical protein